MLRTGSEQGCIQAVVDAVRSSAGKSRQLMKQVRDELSEMLRLEDARWMELEAQARTSSERSMLFLEVGALLGLLIVGLGSSARAFNEMAERRQKSEALLAKQAEEVGKTGPSRAPASSLYGFSYFAIFQTWLALRQ